MQIYNIIALTVQFLLDGNEREVNMDQSMLVAIICGSLGAMSGVLTLTLGCIIVIWMMKCWRAKTSSFHNSKQGDPMIETELACTPIFTFIPVYFSCSGIVSGIENESSLWCKQRCALG